eukprot:gene811-9061_t
MSSSSDQTPNKNTNLVKTWKNNDTLEEIVKVEYKKKNKSEFTKDHIKRLRDEGLKFLEDWKDLNKEDKKKYPDGLKHLLDKVAGFEPESVSLKNKINKIDQKNSNNNHTSKYLELKGFDKWISGIEKMIEMKKEDTFTPILKSKFVNLINIQIFLEQSPNENMNVKKYLCYRILLKYTGIADSKKLNYQDLPDSIQLLDVLRYMKEKTENDLFIIHIDEVQALYTWRNDDERKNTFLHQILEFLLNSIVESNDVKIIFCFTGLHSDKAIDVMPFSGISYDPIDLNLLSVEDMEDITSDLTEKLGIDVKFESSNVFRSFLSLLLGNPRLFSHFLSSCSYYENEDTNTQCQSESKFSNNGFKIFLQKKYFNDKNVLWKCLALLYEQLHQLTYKKTFNSLNRINNNGFYLTLLHCVLHTTYIRKEQTVPHSKITFEQLEAYGYIYLERKGKKYEVKIPLTNLYHLSTLIQNLTFPILNLNETLSWEDNEMSDLCLILLKLFCNTKVGAIKLDPLFGVENIKTKPLDDLQILKSKKQITSFEGFFDLNSNSFVNGKGSPWADSGIKLPLKSNPQTFKDYFYILIQSKRKEYTNKTESLTTEWRKIEIKDKKFMKNNVL